MTKKISLLVVLIITFGALLLSPASQAAASQSLSVTIEVDTLFGEIAVLPSPFTAHGPAVDAGLLCPSGTVSDLLSIAAGPPSDGPINFHVIKLFECADGSGTATIQLNAHVIFDPFSDVGPWNVLAATGAYANLHGTGTLEGTPTATGVYDVYTGSLHQD